MSLSASLPAQEPASAEPAALIDLYNEFHAWRESNQPVSPHAALRVRRPVGWSPDWTRTALQRRKEQYLQFQGREKGLDAAALDTTGQIDAAMLGAALARFHWELEVLDRPGRDPAFYLDQSLGALFEVLIADPGPSEKQVEELIRRLHRFTPLINSARLQLDTVVPSLARAAIERIGDVDTRADALDTALDPFVTERLRYDFNIGMRAFRQSLATFKDWLTVSLDGFDESSAIGLQRLRWFLGHVAMVPRSPEALLVESELAVARVGAELALTKHRFDELPPATLLDSVARLDQMAAISLGEVSAFLETSRLVSLDYPAESFSLGALPATLSPLADEGERIIFLQGDERSTTRYLLADPGKATGLERQAWIDPRLLINWDGVPGRHLQFLAAMQNPRLIRRTAIEASQSQGVALYFHDLVRNAGLYAFQPHSRILALNTLRQAAALAYADIRMAAGEWSAADAARFLGEHGGFESAAAENAVWRLLSQPGMAVAAFATYGQLERFMSDAAGIEGDQFDLARFNDRLLMNAHVPVALQRWEYLGLEDELEQLAEQRGRPATVPQ